MFLFLSVIMVAWFYRLLPAEVAYHFNPNAPDSWVSRSAIILWTLLPQFGFALLAAGIVWGAVRLSARFQQPVSGQASLDTLLALMGNMVALPQALLSFTMLNVFSYNAYQKDIMPLWALAVLVMGLGALALGVFFFRAIRQLQKPADSAKE